MARTPRSIIAFRGSYAFLSNFYNSGVPIDLGDGLLYPTAEHAFQAMKTDDMLERQVICAADTPHGAKRLGRKVNKRADWDAWYRVWAMDVVLTNKFHGNEKLTRYLLATGDAVLIEGNDWGDTYWGQVDGKGQNMLGILLMVMRQNLRMA
jgi:N-glycosidase YbiA